MIDVEGAGRLYIELLPASHNLKDNTMRWYLGIPFSIVLISIASLAAASMEVPVVRPMIVLTALWASVDSHRIELKAYHSGLSYHPIVLFVAIALLWIAGFPWYLHVRYRIKNGLAERKQPYERLGMPDAIFLGIAIFLSVVLFAVLAVWAL